MLCVSPEKSAGRGAGRGVDRAAAIQGDKWGAAEAFAKPWSGRTRPLLIEATRCGSYASVCDRCAGRGVDRVAAIIQGDAVSSSDRGGRYRFSSKRLVWCAAKRAARRRPLPVDTLARFLGSKTKI